MNRNVKKWLITGAVGIVLLVGLSSLSVLFGFEGDDRTPMIVVALLVVGGTRLTYQLIERQEDKEKKASDDQ